MKKLIIERPVTVVIFLLILLLTIFWQASLVDRKSIENCTTPQLVKSVNNCHRTGKKYVCSIETEVGVWKTALKNFPGGIVQSGDRVYTCDMKLYGRYYDREYRLVCKNSRCL